MKIKSVILAKNVKILFFSKNFRFSKISKFSKFSLIFFENVEKSKNLKIFEKIEILKILAKMTFLIFIFQNVPEKILVNGFWNSKK